MRIERLTASDLGVLTELFEYNDAEQMMAKCAEDIRVGRIGIFLLYEGDLAVGELRAMYGHDDERFAVKGKRAYMYAFRVRDGYRSRGYGSYLLKSVLDILQEDGYTEFTVGVEDDNDVALRIYQSFGFDEFVLRKKEEYQGDSYEYNLYLRR